MPALVLDQAKLYMREETPLAFIIETSQLALLTHRSNVEPQPVA